MKNIQEWLNAKSRDVILIWGNNIDKSNTGIRDIVENQEQQRPIFHISFS